MKIVHITTVHHPYDIRIFYKQLRSLHSSGYEVCEIACCDEDHVKDGIAIRAISRPKNRWERFVRCGYQAIRKGLREKADIYHLHDPELLPWAIIFRCMGKQIVFDMHENVSKAVLSKVWIPRLLRKPIAFLVKHVESCLLWRVPVIFAEYSYLDSFPRQKIYQIVLNYPRHEMLSGVSADKYEQKTFVYLGDISKERGISNIIRATNQLRAEGVDCQFKCIGYVTDELKSYFDGLIEPQSAGHVHFLGRLGPDDAYRIVAASHIGFSILLPTPNYIGSFATKILEYMGMGLPVVAGDFQVNKDVLEKERAGICVDPEDLAAVVVAVRTLLDDPALVGQMAARGRAAVAATYNWDREFKKIERLYHSVLA